MSFFIIVWVYGCPESPGPDEDNPLQILAELQNVVEEGQKSEAENLIQGLKKAIEESGTPLVKEDKATFVVFPKSEAKAVMVKGIFSADSGKVDLVLEKLGEFDVWIGNYQIVSNTEFIYNIDIDGSVTEDPLCKRWLIGFGKHSVGRMPDFDPWVDRALSANPPPGKMESFDIQPHKLDGLRKIQVYLPPGYDKSTQRYPVLYIHDGPQAIVDGKVPQIVDYLLADDQIEQLILCFVPPRDRFREYGDQADIYADFLVNEVVPKVDAHYRTKKDPKFRGVTGASMGGRISTYLVVYHSDVFHICISQSAYFEENCVILRDLKSSPQLPVRFYVDIGVFERGVVDRDLVDVNQDFRDLLTGKGYDVVYREWPGGHCWLTWSRGIGEALPLFWPAED